MTNMRYQVIIVGGGPVGVGLAVDLGLRGISCVLLERRSTIQRIPKGQNLTQRTLEHFSVWGIADALRAARVMPPGFPIGGVTAYGNLMSEYWKAPPGREAVRAFYAQDNHRMPQYQLEQVLRDKLQSVHGVDARFGWTVTALDQHEAGARVVAVADDGRSQTLEADYVIGCDGGRSTIRELAGIQRHGTDFEQMMVLAVFRSRDLHERLKRFPERSTYRVMSPALKGFWQFFGRVDVGESWFFHAPVPCEARSQDFDFKGLIQEAAGFEFECTFEHVGFWDLAVSVADEYQAGRVFIAGDAAHSHPPYGSFGLNNGLEDAVNLSWKLAATLQGWGGENLLSSYSLERSPVFKELGEDFIAAGIRAEKTFLETYSPERDRAEFERAWGSIDADDGTRVRDYEPNYEGSPIVWGPPGGMCRASGTHMLRARPGHHLAPRLLSNGQNVFDTLNRDFTLLAFDANDDAIKAFSQAAATLGIPLKLVNDTLAEGREAYEARLVLVRPDQFVAWAGQEAPADAVAVLSRAVARS